MHCGQQWIIPKPVVTGLIGSGNHGYPLQPGQGRLTTVAMALQTKLGVILLVTALGQADITNQQMQVVARAIARFG